MTAARDIRATILDALLEVAPEVDPTTVVDDVELQRQLELDSMDFLAFLEGIAARTGVEVPEGDYQAVATLAGCVAYVSGQLPTAAG